MSPASDVDEYGRPEPPAAGDEVSTLLGFLDHHRATLSWKCAGLDTAGLSTQVGASSLTLGGLLKHAALVEVDWFVGDLHGRGLGRPWSEVDDPGQFAWASAADDSPEQLRELWSDAVHQAREATAEALADGGLDRLTDRVRSDGFRPSLRWLLLHMIEEYARHNGHADLIREAVDGSVGQ